MLSYIDTLHLQKKQVLTSHGSTESLDFKEINESISTKFAQFVMISLIYEDVINVLFKILLARNLWSNYVAGSFCQKKRLFALNICRSGKYN